MANRYLELIEKRARQELEDLNQAQQRAIIEAYNSAGKRLVRSYRGARDGTATKALLASYTQKIAEETQQIIEQYAIKGAQIAPSVEKLIMQEAFRMAGLDTSLANDKFDNIIGKLGMESVKNVIGGKIYKDGAGLSARIWQASAMANNRIQEIITAGLAQDMGAAKLSKLLQDYVNPAARKTWDNKKIREILGGSYARWNSNLEYNALRLARTTLAHTATMSMRQAQKINPYATKIMWHSVHAAGRTCSICEEMDGQVYDTDKCPFDHPNGMCYQTHEFDKSLDEIADELAAWCRGEENEMLDEWWKAMGGPDERPVKVVLPKTAGSTPKTEQTKKSTTSEAGSVEWLKEQFGDMDSAKLQKRLGMNEEQLNYFLEELSLSSPEYQKTMVKTIRKMRNVSEDGTKAYYRSGEKRIFINHAYQTKVASEYELDSRNWTFWHEAGHCMDYLLSSGYSNMQGSVTSSAFQKAFIKDLNAISKMPKDKLKVLVNDHTSRGVQDILGAMKHIPKEGGGTYDTGNRYMWGHSDDYWKRRNAQAEASSELWAHLSVAEVSKLADGYMDEFFPNSRKVFRQFLNRHGK